jgi:hypothetical protein
MLVAHSYVLYVHIEFKWGPFVYYCFGFSLMLIFLVDVKLESVR